jgi:hypothetical protein
MHAVPCMIKDQYVIRFTITSQRTTSQVPATALQIRAHFLHVNCWCKLDKNLTPKLRMQSYI